MTSPVINTSVSGSAIDTDLASTSGSDDTLASAKAIKTYVDAVTTSLNAQDLDFSGDSGGAQNVDLDTQSLTVAGGTGIATTGSSTTLTVDIDSTVTTLSGTQTLTNKTLTTPVVASLNQASGTNTLTMPAATDTLVGRGTTDTLTNKSIDVDNNTITNIEVDNLKSGVLDTDISTVSGSDDTLASAKAIKTYVDDNAGGGGAGSIDTLFTLQAKSEDAAYTAIGNGYVWTGAGSSLTNATLALETTAADLIQAEKVFAYDSSGSGVRNWWHHEKVIQPGYGGKNMVLQLQYFTRNCADSNIFRFYARNASKPIFTSTGSADGSNTVAGTITYDASLPSADRLAAAVGDRVVLLDTSNAIHYRYITVVSATTTTPSASLTITY